MKHKIILSIAFIFTLLTIMPTHVFAETSQRINIPKRLKQDTNIVPGRLLFKLKGDAALPNGQALSAQRVSKLSSTNRLPVFTKKFSIKSIKSDSSTSAVSQSTGKLIAAASMQANVSQDYILDLNNPRDLNKALEACKKDSAIEYCQPSYIYSSYSFPIDEGSNDPDYKKPVNKGQFDYMKFVNEAWLKSMGEGVKVAVLDSAFLADHEDLQDNIWLNAGEFPVSVDANADGRITLQELIAAGLGDTDGQDGIQLKDLYGSAFEDKIDNDGNGFIDDMMGWNFYSEEAENGTNNVYRKLSGHGTTVMSVVGAVGNNNKGSIGAASKVQIILVQVGSDTRGESDGNGRGSDIEAKGIRYAVDSGAQVINYSRGTLASADNKLKEAVEYALNHGVVFVAAAGNGDSRGVPIDVSNIVPASFDEVIAVGSLKNNGTKSSTSNFGAKIGVWAIGQGVAVAGSYNIKSYDTASQTSHATPWVTGAVAMLLSKNMKEVPDQNSPRRIKASEVKGLIKSTCEANTHTAGLCVLNALDIVSIEPPVLTAIADKQTQVGELVEFSVTASDANDNLSEITIDGETPAGATLISTETPSRKIFRWTPGVATEDGEYTVSFKATDATGLKDIKTVKITVIPPQSSGTPKLKFKSLILRTMGRSDSFIIANSPLQFDFTLINYGDAPAPATVMDICLRNEIGIYTSQDPEVIEGTAVAGSTKYDNQCRLISVPQLAPQATFSWSCENAGWPLMASPIVDSRNYVGAKLDVSQAIQRTSAQTPLPFQTQYTFQYKTYDANNLPVYGNPISPRQMGILLKRIAQAEELKKRITNEKPATTAEPAPQVPLNRPGTTTSVQSPPVNP